MSQRSNAIVNKQKITTQQIAKLQVNTVRRVTDKKAKIYTSNVPVQRLSL